MSTDGQDFNQSPDPVDTQAQAAPETQQTAADMTQAAMTAADNGGQASAPETNATPAASAAWYDGLNLPGVQLDRFSDPKQFATAAHAAIIQQRREVEHLRQQAAQAEELRQRLAALDQERQRQQQAAESEARKPKYQVPDFVREFPTDWRGRVTRDENGRYVPLPGEDPNLLVKIRQYNEWLESQQRTFFNDPVNFIDNAAWPVLEERIEKMLTERTQAVDARIRQEWEARQILEQHKPLLYQLDQTGQPLRNYQTGEYLLTDVGQKVAQFMPLMQQAATSGDQQAMFNLAFLLATNGAVQQPAAAPAAPVVPAQQAPTAARDASNLATLQRRATARPQASGGRVANKSAEGMLQGESLQARVARAYDEMFSANDPALAG